MLLITLSHSSSRNAFTPAGPRGKVVEFKMCKCRGLVVDAPPKKQLAFHALRPCWGNPEGPSCAILRSAMHLMLIAQGLMTKEVAIKLFISVPTVETHRSNLIAKAKMRNATAPCALCDKPRTLLDEMKLRSYLKVQDLGLDAESERKSRFQLNTNFAC